MPCVLQKTIEQLFVGALRLSTMSFSATQQESKKPLNFSKSPFGRFSIKRLRRHP